jgi:hypothetical protein
MRRTLFLLCGFLLWPNLVLALTNSDFEQPVAGLSPTTFLYYPTGASWTFNTAADGSGLTGKQSAFTSGQSFTSTSGQYLAFIQGHGSFSQDVYLPAGTYVATLSAAQRTNYQYGTQVLAITVGGTQRGTFTPAGGDLQNYSTAQFNISTSGTKTLTIAGNGSGTDYTGFIDNITISKVTGISLPINTGTGNGSTSNVGTPCNSSLANFQTNFNGDLTKFGMWVRNWTVGADNSIIATDTSGYVHDGNGNLVGYDASVNTLLGPHSQDCQRNKTTATTAQTTVQQLGNYGGALLLSQDSISGLTGGNAAYGVPDLKDQNGQYPQTFWANPGDSVEVEADMRMTMFASYNDPCCYPPVGQYYIAINLIDSTDQGTPQRTIQFGVGAYDSRNAAPIFNCDAMGQSTAYSPVYGTSITTNALGCKNYVDYYGRPIFDGKFIWVPSNSATLVNGDSGPGYGAWSTYRTFKFRLDRSALQNVLNDIQAHKDISGLSNFGYFSTNPSNYKLSALAILMETQWWDSQNRNVLNMASSHGNLKLNRYVAK